MIARANLQRQGYEVYLPRLSQSVKHRGRWREKVMPLFPRYLFLRLNEGREALAPVHSTVGVARVVRFGASYAIVPDHVISGLRARADTESGLHRLEHATALRPGMAVRIASGPFDGLEGVFQREVGAERVVVLLNLLGQNTSVRVSANAVITCFAALEGC